MDTHRQHTHVGHSSVHLTCVCNACAREAGQWRSLGLEGVFGNSNKDDRMLLYQTIKFYEHILILKGANIYRGRRPHRNPTLVPSSTYKLVNNYLLLITMSVCLLFPGPCDYGGLFLYPRACIHTIQKIPRSSQLHILTTWYTTYFIRTVKSQTNSCVCLIRS